MNITKLKAFYQQKANELRTEYDIRNQKRGVTLKGIYSIPYHGYNELVFKALADDEIRMNTFNHLYVYVEKRGHFDKSYYRPDKEEIEYYKNQSVVLLEYWTEYAKLKKYDGVVFCRKENYLDCEIFAGVKEVLLNKIPSLQEEAHTKLLSNIDNKLFMGGLISKEWQSYMDCFFTAKELFENAIITHPLITLKDIDDTWDIYRTLIFKYCGEEIEFTMTNNFSEAVIWFNNSTQFKEQIALPFNADSLNNFFLDTKEQLLLPNVIKPPMDNFKRVITRVFRSLEKEKHETYFNELTEELGNWVELESEMSYILKAYDEYDFYEQGILHINEGRKAGVEMQLSIFEFKTEKQFFYFIYKRIDYNNSFSIVVSQEEKPEVVKKELISHLL